MLLNFCGFVCSWVRTKFESVALDLSKFANTVVKFLF